MRRTTEMFNDQNYDSFLDIVANLVGILVILIMVIGVRAKNVAQTSPTNAAEIVTDDSSDSAPAPEIVESSLTTEPIEISMAPIKQLKLPPLDSEKIDLLSRQLSEEKAKALRLNADAHNMAATIKQLDAAAQRQDEERTRLQLAISLSEKAIAERRTKLGNMQQIQLALAEQMERSQHELKELHRQISAIETIVRRPTNVLEHTSTPLAKTVFGREEHFRIVGGRVAYVPMPEIVEMMKRDVMNKKWKMENQNEATQVIGPVNGFYGRYTIEKRRGIVQTDEGPRMAETIELREIDMVPEENTQLGEPVDVALDSAESEFMQRIGFLNPEDTTITVWVYPDGYESFRELKETLSSRGFRTAARVLRHGYLIGGAPTGSKSAAE